MSGLKFKLRKSESIVSFHVDVEVSSDQGGVLEGTSKGRTNLKLYDGLARFRLRF